VFLDFDLWLGKEIFLQNLPTDLVAHQASYLMGSMGSSPVGKSRLRVKLTTRFPSSIQIKNDGRYPLFPLYAFMVDT
jgi:hypothetical protein